MTSAPLTNVGPYTVESEIGRGGMGVVYKGMDTRLDRAVAIKSLPEHFADNPERLARFEREARTLAQLNHPNVAGIYGVEEHEGARFLILEYVEGETLADRLRAGPLSVHDTIEILAQVAAGLEAAHNAGVIHRDLKPDNIRITPEGVAKVLDFGLARADESSSSTGSSVSQAPTITSPHSPTVPGAILGTAPYMSPEQTRGKTVDKRTDVWSFGVVLYECLTGISPFSAETLSDSISLILQSAPDLEKIPASTPPMVRHVLGRCLERDKSKRWRDIGDVGAELRGAEEAGFTGPIPIAPPRQRLSSLLFGLLGAAVCAAILLLLGVAGIVPIGTGGPAAGRNPTRFALQGMDIPDDTFHSIAISPDGLHLVVRIREEIIAPMLYFRPLDSLELKRIENSESGWLPFFSPDGRKVGFFAIGEIRTASVDGSAAQVIGYSGSGFSGGAWMPDDTIIFGGTESSSLFQIPASGGEAERLEVKGLTRSEIVIAPSPLPGGDAVLCAVRRNERFDVAVYSRTTQTLEFIAQNGFNAKYSPTGHVIYQQGEDGPLMALPFDGKTLKPTGNPIRLPTDLGARVSYQVRLFDFSDTGTFVYFPEVSSAEVGQMVMLDASGAERTVLHFDKVIDMPVFSHDETKVAFRTPAPNCDVWTHDLERNVTTRITREADNHGIAWSSDDRYLYTARRGDIDWGIVAARADGASGVREIVPAAHTFSFLNSMTEDGKYAIVSAQRDTTRSDLFLVDVEAGTSTPFLESRFDEYSGAISPDGGLIAYTSDESGRTEVYVHTFPALDARVQASVEGGIEPVWSDDGRTLYFRNGRRLYSVAIGREPSLTAGTPNRLFEWSFARSGGSMASYDVSADGQHFVAVRQAEGSDVEAVVIVDWFTEIERATR